MGLIESCDDARNLCGTAPLVISWFILATGVSITALYYKMEAFSHPVICFVGVMLVSISFGYIGVVSILCGICQATAP